MMGEGDLLRVVCYRIAGVLGVQSVVQRRVMNEGRRVLLLNGKSVYRPGNSGVSQVGELVFLGGFPSVKAVC